MVVLLERPPEGQNLPAAVAPSIGPVAPDQSVASQLGVFQAGLRPTGDINIPLPDAISGQSPLYTDQDYRDAVDRMTGSFRESGVDGQTVSEIVRDMNALRDGDAEMMASVQKAADDIQNGNLNQADRNVWEIIIDALKNITPEQRNFLLTDAGITYGAVAGFWLSRKYFDRLKLSPNELQIAGLLLAAGSITCVIGGQVMATASQTAPAPDGSPPSPAPTSPDRTPAPAPNATPSVESATPGSPDGYSPATLLGSKDAYNTVAEAIDQSGQPITETAKSTYIKAHKFSEADLQSIVDSGSPQYGITVDSARNTLENITLMKNLTAVNVPGSRVYYFFNGLTEAASRGFMLLVSADGNSVWLAKNKATGALNYFPNTFPGIDLSGNFTPEQLAQFVRPWQPADAEPQETDRLITQVDISTIGGIDQLNVVFQPGTENAYLVGTTNQVKSGIDVVKSVFDSETQKWLVIEFSTPTPDPTVQPTSTETSTATSTPTETQRPRKVVFQDDFLNGINITPGRPEGWNNLHKQGASVEVIDDPTNSTNPDGSPRGKVLKSSIVGTSALEGDNWVRRGYPDWTNTGGYYSSETVNAPAAIQVDVWVSSKLIAQGDKPSVSLLSFHTNRRNKPSGVYENPIYAVGLSIASGGNYLGITDSKGRWITLTSVPFKANTWFTLELVVESDGRVLPYINGKLALPKGEASIIIPGNAKIGFGDGHAGLYSSSGNTQSPDFPDGAYLLNDNFMIIQH